MDDLIQSMRGAACDTTDDDAAYLLRHAADALEAAREDAWQPIETAPRGEVLLYWPAIRPAPGRPGNCLSEMMRVGRAGDTPARIPTHWMPLPAPPKEARND